MTKSTTMSHTFSQLTHTPFDILIIGGGIYGAQIAWDASLRGLRVALVEKDDFAAHTSSNSLKIIHGGSRYLQSFDIQRVRTTINECATLLRVAPHLVSPIACCLPLDNTTHLHPTAMRAALAVYDAIGFDRNRGVDHEHQLPPSRMITPEACASYMPHYKGPVMRAGALWYEGQLYNSERLILSLLNGARAHGAVCINYCAVTEILREKNRAIGVRVHDVRDGTDGEIRAGVVVNAAGPWIEHVARLADPVGLGEELSWGIWFNLILNRPWHSAGALGLKTWHSDDPRYIFFKPWRNKLLVGLGSQAFDGSLDRIAITPERMAAFIHDINDAYPGLAISEQDIAYCLKGVLPAEAQKNQAKPLAFLKQYRLFDHKKIAHLDGFISVLGVKYTTARYVATQCVNLVLAKLRRKRVRTKTDTTVIHDSMKTVQQDVQAEVLHGIRAEMAHSLSEIVFRRTQLGTAGYPDDQVIEEVARIMARECAWSEERKQEEIKIVKEKY